MGVCRVGQARVLWDSDLCTAFRSLSRIGRQCSRTTVSSRHRCADTVRSATDLEVTLYLLDRFELVDDLVGALPPRPGRKVVVLGRGPVRPVGGVEGDQLLRL